jgi:hypothetical protein
MTYCVFSCCGPSTAPKTERIPVPVHRGKLFQDTWNRNQATMPRAN